MATFFIAILLIIGIVIIFDISEKIDKLVANQAPLKAVIFDYYVNFIPYFMNMYSSMFVFISVIFFTSRMAANTEIIAILSGGISYHRMMVPYLAASFLIALLSLGLSLYIIPNANVKRLAFEQEYVKNKTEVLRDLHYQIAPGQFVFAESFSSWSNTAYRFTLEEFKDSKLVSKISAETAVWDSTTCSWQLRKYFIRDYGTGMSDRVRTGNQLDTTIALSVNDFYRNKQDVQKLVQGDLKDQIRVQKMRGDSNVIYAQIEQHNRWAMPFSCIILAIMGMSLSTRKKRGGTGWNLALGIALAFSYILFQRFAQMFVFTGILPPGFAIWTPNILFIFITAFLYRIAPK